MSRLIGGAATNGGATTGHEAELLAMADALRGSMAAAEYKYVVPFAPLIHRASHDPSFGVHPPRLS